MIVRLTIAVVFAGVPAMTVCAQAPAQVQSPAANPEEAAYTALGKISSVTSSIESPGKCFVKGKIDFNGFVSNLPIFRDAWFNKDYSIDFYSQRRKQFFIYIIVKRLAELMTEKLYRKDNPQQCFFSISTTYFDKFGQNKEVSVTSWRFTSEQNAKINWDNIDPRNFDELMLDNKISQQANDWMSDEPPIPSVASQTPRNEPAECNSDMLAANAFFMRATTYCKRDYLDSKAGYYALEKSRQCASMGDEYLQRAFMRAATELDSIARKHGRAAACRFVDTVEQQVLRASSN